MTKKAAEPLDRQALATGEVHFSYEELFFSRTNEKGHILSGNAVFQRVSLYGWDELLGKPHNVIRHPDMPRAVFWLLWDRIRKGEPIGAYVKNRAKDGRHYWVFAIVTPVEGGYLSVRLKPSGPLFRTIEKEYQSLVGLEQSQRLKPAESAQILLDRLAQLGFRNYAAFMAKALGQEIVARNEVLRRPPDPTVGHFDALAEAAQTLTVQSNLTFEAYAVNAYVPLNLRVQAAQLGEIAATIGVISSNYNIISEEMKSMLTEFMALAEQVSEAVNGALFLVCTAKIQKEIAEIFQREPEMDGVQRDTEARLLDAQNRTYQQNAIDSLYALSRQAERFHGSCTEMKRLAAGLEVTRVMGKIESARLDTAAEGLNDLIDSLEDFQAAISESLKEIDRMNRAIYRSIQDLLLQAEHAA